MKKTRITVIIVLIVLVQFCLILSVNHTCDGDHCAVCAAISAVNMAIPAATVLFCFVVYAAARFVILQSRESKKAWTPVSMHVLDLN